MDIALKPQLGLQIFSSLTQFFFLHFLCKHHRHLGISCKYFSFPINCHFSSFLYVNFTKKIDIEFEINFNFLPCTVYHNVNWMRTIWSLQQVWIHKKKYTTYIFFLFQIKTLESRDEKMMKREYCALEKQWAINESMRLNIKSEKL